MGERDALPDVAEAHSPGIREIALAWLLIPATASVGHLEQNETAGDLQPSADEMNALNAPKQVGPRDFGDGRTPRCSHRLSRFAASDHVR
ncbi:hypothetical protein DEJ05_08150 [Curtobacterium sp. MCLR17_045]|uniref:hypothetical protein n=1 Tax=Curtobacterium sp. MCLR17_045 TaxID=2175629 RepID=UPI000DA81B64|nr:hypothetical protein [Curtobacterium sp. MCLR17_045]PZF26868.1 hypothetical protein DEJ05_08150 [Curtobacterium sp. MCLR17_045]